MSSKNRLREWLHTFPEHALAMESPLLLMHVSAYGMVPGVLSCLTAFWDELNPDGSDDGANPSPHCEYPRPLLLYAINMWNLSLSL